MQRILFCLLFVISVGSAVQAEGPLPPQLEALRKQGVRALFNMDYAQAESAYSKMVEIAPDHPAGHIYMANTVWLKHLASLRRLQTNIYNRRNFFKKTEDKPDPEVDRTFRAHMEKGIKLAEERYEANKRDVPTLYYLGIGKNIMAGYEATVKRAFFAALRNGSKGVDYHRKAIKLDPTFLDAQLSIGMYNYVVGSLPFGVKILAFLGGVRGSKKEGIKQLQQVATDGNFARDEAKSLLIMIHDREKEYEKSLKLLKDLSQSYTGNFLFRLQMADTLALLERYEESYAIFEDLLIDPSATEYMLDLIHFQYAAALASAGNWERAYEHYRTAGLAKQAPEPMVTMALLEGAKALDAMVKRQDAIQEYQQVLKRKETLDSHDQARKYMKKPFQP